MQTVFGDNMSDISFPKVPVRPSQLTKRERQVRALLLMGKSNKEIAEALGIAERTVKFDVANVLHKQGVSTRVGFLVRASRRK